MSHLIHTWWWWCTDPCAYPFFARSVAAMDPHSIILIAGPRKSGKGAVARGLHALNAAASQESTPTLEPSSRRLPLHLDNKYYSAKLLCHIVEAEEWETPSTATIEILKSTEALILVADASAEAPNGGAAAPAFLDSANRWSELARTADIGTLLCVVNKYDSVSSGHVPGAGEEGSDADLLSQRAVDTPALGAIAEWCLEHGFEHVLASAASPLVGAGRREKLGMPRVFEALQSVSWTSMAQKQGGVSAVRGAEGSVTSIPPPLSQRANSPPAAAPEMPLSQDDGLTSIAELLALSGVGGSRSTNADDEQDENEEVYRMINEMRRVREAALTGNLTDQQRRDAAAKVAEDLFRMLAEEEEEGGNLDAQQLPQPQGAEGKL